MTEEQMLTKHPSGKRGRNISKQKYETLRKAILAALRGRGKELSHDELMAAVEQRLQGRFAGNIGWYAETVKLDLEARKLIERAASRPQTYRLK
jgi:hypothetical protein